jgi:hypothetical protein
VIQKKDDSLPDSAPAGVAATGPRDYRCVLLSRYLEYCSDLFGAFRPHNRGRPSLKDAVVGLEA